MNRLSDIVRRNRLFLVGLAVFLTIAGFGVWNALVPHNDARIASIRKGGYPVTLAELDAWHPAVPDSENFALILTNAFARLALTNTSGSTLLGNIPLPARGQAFPPEDRAELVSVLASNDAALKIVRSAKSLPRSRYPTNSKQGFDTLLPHLANVKGLVYLLAADAVLDAADGKNGEAVGSLLTAGRVANSLTAEPLLISQLVRMACWNFIASRLELVLNSATLTDDQLVLLQKMFAEAEQPQTLARAFAGERASGLSLFDAPGGFFLGSQSSPKTGERMGARMGMGLLKVTGFFQKDRSYYLDVMATNVAAAELPYSERFKAGQQASALTMTRPNRFCIMSGLLLPGLSKAHLRAADYTARIRVARVALAVERHRRAHGGALPESLDQLSPSLLKLPTDPIDGQPLRFKRFGPGYVIYSIGSDAKDDGGTEVTPKNPGAAHDITFILER